MMKKIMSLFLTLFITLSIINIMNPSQDTMTLICNASFFDDVGDTITGFGRFFNAMKAAADPVAALIGFKAVMLFLGILLISTGLSFLGLPRGKASFYTSLITADILWILWAWSFDPEDINYLDLLFSIFKTNLILLLPFLIISFIKRSPIITKKLVPAIKSLIKLPFVNSVKLHNNQLINMSDKFYETSMSFQRSLMNDIIRQKDEEEIIISSETLKYGQDTQELLCSLINEA